MSEYRIMERGDMEAEDDEPGRDVLVFCDDYCTDNNGEPFYDRWKSWSRAWQELAGNLSAGDSVVVLEPNSVPVGAAVGR